MSPLLSVENLSATFHGPAGDAHVLNGISLELEAGRTLGIVGESGGGKSVLIRTLMGLHQDEPATTVTGRSVLAGTDILSVSAARRRRLWGGEIAMIFQNPMTSLNPVRRLGSQLVSAIRLHRDVSRGEARQRAVELLDRVRIADPARRLRQHPHELSGGMRQRVCIALALAAGPKVLLADEPTTALDVTVQHQILDLLAELAEQERMATILITHDLGVVAHQAHDIAVLYAGRIVEQGATAKVLEDPQHPYTRALLRSTPRLASPSGTSLATLGGHPPSPVDPLPGCPFEPRCDRSTDRCRTETPILVPVADPAVGHRAACFHPGRDTALEASA